jgi:hypothetical protein
MSDTTSSLGPYNTPMAAQGSSVTQAIMNYPNSIDTSNDREEPNVKQTRRLKFTPEQLSQLIMACSTPVGQMSVPTQASLTSIAIAPSTAPVYVTNAKYEEICCKPIKPLYEGTEEDLIPFLLHLDIRSQDEGWAPATYITIEGNQYGLTIEFAHVNEDHVTECASKPWSSSTVAIDKHSIGHDTSHLLAKCLLASIPLELPLTLLNCIPKLYCNDGTYILWALTNNIYKNYVAFVEHVREKIVMATVSQHDNNIEKYLIYIKNHLQMITTKPTSACQHRDLITSILCRLKTTSNQIFLRTSKTYMFLIRRADYPNTLRPSLLQM